MTMLAMQFWKESFTWSKIGCCSYFCATSCSLDLYFWSLGGEGSYHTKELSWANLVIPAFKMQAAAQDSSVGSHKDTGPAEISTDQAAPDVQEESIDDLEDSDEEYSSLEEGTEHPAPSESKSFASTYWRPERHDRKGALSAIDERCVFLILN